MKQLDRNALREWEEYRHSLKASTTVDYTETAAQQQERIKRLEANPEAWFKYYFEKYCTSEPAQFHKKDTKILFEHDRVYMVRAWSRELAKDARTMFEFLYLTLTGQLKNIILTSHSWDQACDLLLPYKINLEKNKRIINDYGLQEQIGQWEEGRFITRQGVSWRALGSGQSPRGTRNEEARPDGIILSDIDTDEEVLNPQRIKKKWDWIEQALFGTFSVSGKRRIVVLGNIIGKDTCITRAIKMADFVSLVNIRDKYGRSSWPEKNSEDHIDYTLSKISYISGQKEYFNNPIEEGTVFKEMRWDKVPPLNKFRFLVAYGDPAPSNKENKSNCHKACFLMGIMDGVLYVFTGFLQHVKNSDFVDWYYFIEDYVKGKTQIYNFIENNSLQDPFYEQVFQPLFNQKGKEKEHHIAIRPDERKKPDKFVRIEGNLEPLNRAGKLIFNIAEANNPNMKLLEEQFKAVNPQLSAPVDGPDCIEGGHWVINNKQKALTPMNSVPRTSIINKKRY